MRPSFPRLAGDGGGKKPVIQLDPALVKYANLYVKRHEYFRWTPRTAWISFMYIFAVPAVTGYFFYATEGKYEMRGKLRGDVIKEF